MELKQIEMSIADWIKVNDNPQQRNTENHARKALKYHLSAPHITHSRAVAAKLPSGAMYKVDGHTRAYLWDKGWLDAPESVFIDLYLVSNIKEASELYESFDNLNAVETAGDKMSGVLRLNGISQENKLLLYGGTTTALKTLYTRRTAGFSRLEIKDVIKPFVKAIKTISHCDFKHKHFPAPVFAAMVLTVQKDGNAALSFWEAYANDEGKKTPKNMDAIHCLTQNVRTVRDRGDLSRGYKSVITCVPQIMAIYEKWGKPLFAKTPSVEGNLNHYVHKYCEPCFKQLDRVLPNKK